MKRLYIVATIFQLVTVINIEVSLYKFSKHEKPDLVISKTCWDAFEDVFIRLNRLDLFGCMYVCNLHAPSVKDIMQSPRLYLWRVCKHTIKRLLKKRPYSTLEDVVAGISFGAYTDIFCYDTDIFKLLKLHSHQRIHYFDEGVGSYLSAPLLYKESVIKAKLSSIYLYVPELAEYYSVRQLDIKPIPRIDMDQSPIKDICGKIFNVEGLPYHADILLFDQPFGDAINRTTPYQEALILYAKKCQEQGRRVTVKLHPRSPKGSGKFYNQHNIDTLPSEYNHMPLEVAILLGQLKVNVFASVFSSASCMLYLCLDNLDESIESLLLYKMVKAEFFNQEQSKPIDRFFVKASQLIPSIKIIDSL